MTQLIVFPHCDMHVALQKPATRVLPFRVFRQELSGNSTTFNLTEVTRTCDYRIFAPHNATGSRLQQFVTIDPAARAITANQVGINLIVIQNGGRYVVARIQVHDDILGWWFGNPSITTALDAAVAHSQPSIYALFSQDATGADEVGDITGHGYVTLTSASPGTFTVANANNEGRLQGVSEGTAQLNGSFLGVNRNLEVTVVDYAKVRNNLATVRASDVANAAGKHNILFLAEGFLAGDQAKFDRIVSEVTDSLFSQPRHEPFNTLEGGFNVFKAFQASKQHLVTCAFRVNDESAPSFQAGGAIPDNRPVSTNENTYTLRELIARVGLPLRNETTTPAQLKTRWAGQSLNLNATEKHYDPARVDDTLIEAWRKSKSLGILETRDTFYGLMLGRRWADQVSHVGTGLTMPANDSPADPNLAPFIRRAYEWFSARSASRSLTPDPRRHPPELHEYGLESRGALIMQYLGNLRLGSPPNSPIGTEWVPDGTFKRSRGLIAMLVNDGMIGGTNFGERTVTANTLKRATRLGFEYPASNTATMKVMRRKPPDTIEPEMTDIMDTVAHEFGHSFNLGDEYEERRGDNPNAFDGYDNIAALSTVFADPNWAANNSRLVDPGKVKWFGLLRIELAAALTAPSSQQGGEMEVTIDRRQIQRWVEAKAQGREAFLRRIAISPTGVQLPLQVGDADYLVRLTMGAINETAGTIRLGGLELPPSPFPVFPAGSLLFVPRRDDAANLVFVVEKKVEDAIKTSRQPLNRDTDTANVNDEADSPKEIPDFKPPCKSPRLIGIYEGASQGTGLVYRPAGDCKMRNQSGAFCHVCKWLITNRVDAAMHDLIDRNFYPEAKKNG